jgi:hypothetical protein
MRTAIASCVKMFPTGTASTQSNGVVGIQPYLRVESMVASCGQIGSATTMIRFPLRSRLPWQSFATMEEATARAVIGRGCEFDGSPRALLHGE